MAARFGSGSDSLVRRTTDSLRRMIVEGSLQLGEALSEVKVAQWLDVSRTPVREAFARLEIEGLVVTEPQRSTCVFKLGPRDLSDICVVRDSLEPKALALAMERRQEDLASELGIITEMMTKAIESEDISKYLRLDTQFHQTIFLYSENEFLYEAYQLISSKLAALRTRLVLHMDYLKKGYGEHIRLSELVASGDVESALDVLEKHISRQEDSFWRLNDGLNELSVRQPSRDRARGGGLELRSRDAKRLGHVSPVRFSSLGSDEISSRHRKNIDEKRPVDETLNSVDEIKQVDEKPRGRPRVHVDDATRKRVWAARKREQKRARRLIAGEPSPKRGRPRKAENNSNGE